MSREDDKLMLPPDPEEDPPMGRQQHELSAWQEVAGQLLRELSDTGELPDAGDEEMLSLLINDALEGIDISARYPALYRRVLAIPQLREAFFDALELLEKSRAGELEPIPGGPSEDLSFLHKFGPVEPLLDQLGGGRWRLSWHKSREQMQEHFELFAPFWRLKPYRFDDELGVITLLHAEWPLESEAVTFQLEAWQPAGQEEILSLALVATDVASLAGARVLMGLQAGIEWGGFRGTADFDQHGRADLPPLPVGMILDANGLVKADLRLTVEKVE
jgi:hypothetical protein